MNLFSFSISLTLVSAIYFLQISVSDSEKNAIVSACCDWNGEYRVNLVPHPTSCLAFYQCEPFFIMNGSSYITIPTLRLCPSDEIGKPQHYDFRECRCLRSHEAVCFDPDVFPEHTADYFNCTDPFVVEGINVKC